MTRQIVGLYSCSDERGLNSFNVKRVNNILEGIAGDKKFMPLSVDRDRTILNGGHRLLVAQMLGLEEVTVLIF